MSTKLEDLFSRFPGVGPKQAKRFVYFLLRQSDYYKRDLMLALEEIKHSGKQCAMCLSYFGDQNRDEVMCRICRSPRDARTLLIVEKELDIEAIEKTLSYPGYYFVIGGLLTGKREEKPSEVLRVRELVSRIHHDVESGVLHEVIYALPVTSDGDFTEEYLDKTISQIEGASELTRTRLARGLSSGLELEYVDADTFRSSFERRA